MEGRSRSVSYGVRILLIEPDIVLGRIYKEALEHANHNVVWARTAQNGLRLLDETPTDLIITELQLAAHNGIEFLYELRSYDDWQKIPVVLLTSVPQVSLVHPDTLQTNFGVVAYLYKPLTKLHDLIEAVNSLQSKTSQLDPVWSFGV